MADNVVTVVRRTGTGHGHDHGHDHADTDMVIILCTVVHGIQQMSMYNVMALYMINAGLRH